MARQVTAASALALLLGSAVPGVEGRALRFLERGSLALDGNSTGQAAHEPPADVPLPEHAVFEVLSLTKPSEEETSECLCPLGKFWHWRLRSCVEQGAWGYECGFFPQEHWHRVCQDGLICRATPGTEDNYHSHGKFEGTSDARPASCVKCTEADRCKVGKQRQEEECMTEMGLAGKACATVRITLPAREVKVNKELTHTATAAASADATVEATASVTHTFKANSSAEASASASADASAKAKAEAELPNGETKVVEAEATKSAEGNATNKAEAQKTVTVKVEATAEATEEHEAEASHTAREVIEVVKSVKPAVAEASHCASVSDGKRALGVEGIKGVSSVLSAEIAAMMESEALTEATRSALESAQVTGKVTAKEAAEIAEQEAEERLKIEAESQAAAKAEAAAEAGAKKKAQESAEAKAKELAMKKAEEQAAAQAKEQAGAAAKKEAGEAAEAAAKDEAEKKAKAAAEDAAKDKAEAKADDAETTASTTTAAPKKEEVSTTTPTTTAAPKKETVPTTTSTPSAEQVEAAQKAVSDLASGGLNGAPAKKLEASKPPVQRKVPEGAGLP